MNYLENAILPNNPRYIDEERIFKKYEITPLIETPDLLYDYQRNTLKDFRPDTATFEHEKSRKNHDSVGKLNTHYYGRRSDKEPFMPDLFLGFTDKDPRSISNDPDMQKLQAQVWHRKDNFKKSFKNDADNSITSKMISEPEMQKLKKLTYAPFKDRYKNFEESTDSWTNGFNVMRPLESKVKLHEVDGVIPDLNGIEDIKTRRDYVTALSLQTLPKGWESTPDHKVKIASYTQLLKSKNLKDMKIMKNKNKQVKDNKVIDNSDQENQLASQLLLATSNFKNKKSNMVNKDNIDSKFKISQNTQVRKINTRQEHMKNNELKTTILTNKQKVLNEVFTNLYTPDKRKVDIRKAVSDFTGNKNNNERGNNKENVNITSKDKKDNLITILHKTIQSNKDTIMNQGNNKETYINKSKNIKEENQQSQFIYKNSLLNKDKLNKNDNTYEVFQYSKKGPELFNNHSNVQTGVETPLQHNTNEKFTQDRKTNNQSNDTIKLENVENDTTFHVSGSKNRKIGAFGNKYMYNKKEYESSILADDNINDSKTIITRKH